MEPQDYTTLARILAGISLALGALAILVSAFVLLMAVQARVPDYLPGLVLLTAGISLIATAAILGTLSEISRNIVDLVDLNLPEEDEA